MVLPNGRGAILVTVCCALSVIGDPRYSDVGREATRLAFRRPATDHTEAVAVLTADVALYDAVN